MVNLDYMLSRVGYEPAREQLVAYAMAHTKVGSGFEKSGEDSAGGSHMEGFTNIIELRPENWEYFVAEMDRVYGPFDPKTASGWRGYALASDSDGGLGLSEDEIEALRRKLTED